MTLLSININKFALIRNARGENRPDIIDVSLKCINFGAKGITVHPRPDQRHIKYSDLKPLSNLINDQEKKIEFNIEGYPSNNFCEIVQKIKPNQVTLVPDPPEAITSNSGWDCNKDKKFLKKIVESFKSHNIRVSLFINPSVKTLDNLADIQPDRVELYTYNYSKNFNMDPNKAIEEYIRVYQFVKSIGKIDVNAGHDLNLSNLAFFLKKNSFN